jgi:hypothetical protein
MQASAGRRPAAPFSIWMPRVDHSAIIMNSDREDCVNRLRVLCGRWDRSSR